MVSKQGRYDAAGVAMRVHHVYTLNACFHADANKEMCRFCANVHANHMSTEHENVSPFLLHV
jgi:hypothetical protein